MSHVFLGCLQDRCLESLNDDPSTSSIVAIASFSDGFSALVGKILIFLVALLWDQCCNGEFGLVRLGFGLGIVGVGVELMTCAFFQSDICLSQRRCFRAQLLVEERLCIKTMSSS